MTLKRSALCAITAILVIAVSQVRAGQDSSEPLLGRCWI